MSEKHTTTSEDFEFFKAECQRYIDLFGLKDWESDYAHKEINGDRAQISFKGSGKIASFFLGIKWGMKPSKRDISMSAFHEVGELLLADNWCMAMNYDIREESKKHLMDGIQHAVIRRLENAVFPLVYNDDSA